MTNLYWLSQVKATEKSLVGDKVFLLSQFLQSNFPIVPGFALGSSAFQEFLTQLEDDRSLIANLFKSSLHLDLSNYQALQSVASQSRRLILEADFPLILKNQIFTAAQKLNTNNLILRPSLVIPYYQQRGNFGILNSQVCLCETETIVTGIKQIWSDLLSAKSLLYWDKIGINLPQVKLAVLIQPINNAIASGTAEISSQTLQIKANWGLGYSIQRGEVEPDRYLIDLTTTNIVNQKIGLKTLAYRLQDDSVIGQSKNILESYLQEATQQEKAVLTTSQITELSQLINKIITIQPQIKYFEWILTSHKTNPKESAFFFTQLNYFAPALDNPSLPTTTKEQAIILLRGVAAAGGKVTAKVIVNKSLSDYRADLTPGAILVTKAIKPHELPLLQKAGGIITEIGGQTSHGAIIARELGIPAIVAATNAIEILNSEDYITLDGDRGIVSLATSPPITSDDHRQQTILKYYADNASNDVPLATQLMVSLSQVNLIEQAINLPIDGVGLIRGEFMLLELLSQRSLKEWLQPHYQTELLEYLTEKIGKFTQEFAPKPVYYRSVDFPLTQTQQEHSVFGSRGTYSYVQDATFFQLELTAIQRVITTTKSNLKLILPFVRSISEWQFCHNLVTKIGLTKHPDFQLWIMAEVPSVIFLLPEYIAAGVQGITIGMNDLTQLLLGVDREQANFEQQGLHSNSLAMEIAIAKLIKTAKTHNIPCSICLSANRQDSEFIDKLIRWGITIISVESHAVRDTYRDIARAEKRLLLDRF